MQKIASHITEYKTKIKGPIIYLFILLQTQEVEQKGETS